MMVQMQTLLILKDAHLKTSVQRTLFLSFFRIYIHSCLFILVSIARYIMNNEVGTLQEKEFR